MYQKYQNESEPIFCYANSKKYKNCLKLLNIAGLHALTLGRVKKMTL